MTETIVIGYNDLHYMTEGWHERSINPVNNLFYRQTTKIATFKINKSGQNEIQFLIHASVSLLGKPAKVCLKHDNKIISEFILDTEAWALRKADISSFPDDIIEFEIETEETVIPDKSLHNGDYRELGIDVASIRLI